MKTIKLAAMMVLALGAGRAAAFHDGGVANCEGCHVMHNASTGPNGANRTFDGTRSGAAVTGATPVGAAPWSDQVNKYLLQGSDQSSTCLICHAGTGSYKILDGRVRTNAATVPGNYTPGGDFAWLFKSFTWVASYGAPGSSQGYKHGHNIAAADFGLTPDVRFPVAPGAGAGGYPQASFTCVSCHDPHGKYRYDGSAFSTSGKPIKASGSYGDQPDEHDAVGAYRLLAGKAYSPRSNGGANQFVYDPPVAAAPASYNGVETAAAQKKVAYGRGMSEWCANCHTNIHLDTYVSGAAGLVHPSGDGAKLKGFIASNYNAYVKTGDMSGGQGGANSYSTLVPFENGTGDLATLKGYVSSSQAADTSKNVMCLSCHRAHASTWDSMLRWNQASTYLTVEGVYPGTDAGHLEATYGEFAMGRTTAETQAGYYGRPATEFATFQRVLCNKCHAKD